MSNSKQTKYQTFIRASSVNDTKKIIEQLELSGRIGGRATKNKKSRSRSRSRSKSRSRAASKK
jgi:hypothetical protein